MRPSTTLGERLFDPERSSFWFMFGWGMIALVVVVRLLWYPVVVSDYTYFVKPWFETMQSHAGLTAFAEPFADYAPMYLYFLKALSAIPISSLYSAKTLSLIFDLIIAGVGYLILKRTLMWRANKTILFLAAAVFFALPTVMVNSSLWGQSDAIYSAGIMVSLFAILSSAPLLAAIAFGFAMSVKLQAIFFLPVLVGYLLRTKDTWKYLLIPPFIYLATMLPVWIAGGQLRYWLFIYFVQATEYPWLSVSAQSIFAFLQPLPLSPVQTNVLFWLGILLACAFALYVAYAMRSMPRISAPVVVLISLAAVLIIPYVLPRMHERYFYLADLFSVLYAFFRPKRFFVPIIVVSASLMSYMPFLYKQVGFLSWAHVDLRVPAALLLIPIGVVLYDLWRDVRPHVSLNLLG